MKKLQLYKMYSNINLIIIKNYLHCFDNHEAFRFSLGFSNLQSLGGLFRRSNAIRSEVNVNI